ncbi:MAG: fructosamine kinase family protein [Gammaproteobacteria bacterium]
MTADFGATLVDIGARLGRTLSAQRAAPVSGGCINTAWRLCCDDGDVFLKTNAPDRLAMFEAEAEGLAELARADGLRVPRVLGAGSSGTIAWLALEYVETGTAASGTERRLATGLALQHGKLADRFGWHRDNTIGSTPQPNATAESWPAFFAGQRLGFQLDLARERGWPRSMIDSGRRLQQRLDAFFDDQRPEPALLHGDLWGGNWATDTRGAPFVFDPAVYYGHREADIAMTRLFGGFGADFYAVYHERWPRQPGEEVRCELYNLYHVLNHLNLFGAAYQAQAEQMIGRLLAEAGI